MKNNFLPSFLDNTNFKYLKLDNKYLASIIITDYPKKISFIQITESIPKDLEYDLSMFIQKQDTNTVLKQLTYHISSSGTEIKTVNENQVDIDILSKIKEDAKNQIVKPEYRLLGSDIDYRAVKIANENVDPNINPLKDSVSGEELNKKI